MVLGKKYLTVNSVLRFFEGYETLLAFDNQKSVFLFRDIQSLQTWCTLQKTLLRTLKDAEKKSCTICFTRRTYLLVYAICCTLIARQKSCLGYLLTEETMEKPDLKSSFTTFLFLIIFLFLFFYQIGSCYRISSTRNSVYIEIVSKFCFCY